MGEWVRRDAAGNAAADAEANTAAGAAVNDEADAVGSVTSAWASTPGLEAADWMTDGCREKAAVCPLETACCDRNRPEVVVVAAVVAR